MECTKLCPMPSSVLRRLLALSQIKRSDRSISSLFPSFTIKMCSHIFDHLFAFLYVPKMTPSNTVLCVYPTTAYLGAGNKTFHFLFTLYHYTSSPNPSHVKNFFPFLIFSYTLLVAFTTAAAAAAVCL